MTPPHGAKNHRGRKRGGKLFEICRVQSEKKVEKYNIFYVCSTKNEIFIFGFVMGSKKSEGEKLGYTELFTSTVNYFNGKQVKHDNIHIFITVYFLV